MRALRARLKPTSGSRTAGGVLSCRDKKVPKEARPLRVGPLRGFPRLPLASGVRIRDVLSRMRTLAILCSPLSGPTSSARLTRRDPRGLNVKTDVSLQDLTLVS